MATLLESINDPADLRRLPRTQLVPLAEVLVRNASAAARASGPGGIRCLDRCGAALVDAVIAAVFNAVTWRSVRSVAPVPSARRGWTATVTPLPVTTANVVPPARWVTDTVDPASSGGSEYRFPR